jgi:hypothetical protein
MSTYKLTYNDQIISLPSENEALSYKQLKSRYEYTIFGSPTSVGVSAGTVSMPFSAFDQIGIRTCWNSDLDILGSNIFWFNENLFKSSTGKCQLHYNFADGTYYQMIQQQMNFDNTNNTFICPNDTVSAYRGAYTTVTANARIYGHDYGSDRNRIVGQIIGVKYQ